MIKAGRCNHDPPWTSPFRGVQVQPAALIGPHISCQNQCVAEQSVHHADIKLLTLSEGSDRRDKEGAGCTGWSITLSPSLSPSLTDSLQVV